MFDLGWSEMLLVVIVAVVVIGPRELPHALRMVTRGMDKLRFLAGEARRHVDDVVRTTEIRDLYEQTRVIAPTELGIDVAPAEENGDEQSKRITAPPPVDTTKGT